MHITFQMKTKVTEVTDHYWKNGELILKMKVEGPGGTIDDWINIDAKKKVITIDPNNKVIQKYIKNSPECSEIRKSQEKLSQMNIVEIIGLFPAENQNSEFIYWVRSQGKTEYFLALSSYLQDNYPNLLIDFLEAHIL